MKKYKYTINGEQYEVVVNEVGAAKAEVEVNGVSYEVHYPEHKSGSQPRPQPVSQPRVVSAPTAAPKPSAPRAAAAPGQGSVASPLPGVIVNVMVQVGDAVKVGDTLLSLEAMKMENNVDSTLAGHVEKILVQKGDSVMEGDTLVIIGD